MNRTVLISLAVSGIACCAILVAQASKNRTLRDGVAVEQEAVEELKRDLRQIDPLTSLGDAKRALPNAASGGGGDEPELGAGPTALSEQSATRVERTRDSIDRLVADLGDMDRSPAAFFRVLPDILRVIQNLSLEEMIAVAESIDAPNGMNNPDGKAISRMVLLLLAAEQDPVRVMQNKEVMKDREIRQSLLSQLAKRDPVAAREWVKNSDLNEGEQQEFENFLTFNVLRSDVGAGLKLLREMRDGDGEASQGYSRIGDMPMPVEKLPDLVRAYKDPSNADMRSEISGMVLRTSSMNGGVAATREASAELEMTPQELSNYFMSDFSDSIHAEPDAAMGWIVEALDEEWQQKTIPSAISTWANRDFNAAGEYLGKMEASKTKDMAIGQFARTVSRVDPEAAAVWTLEISDERMRSEAVSNVTGQWRAKNQEAAIQWLEENDYDSMGRPVVE